MSTRQEFCNGKNTGFVAIGWETRQASRDMSSSSYFPSRLRQFSHFSGFSFLICKIRALDSMTSDVPFSSKSMATLYSILIFATYFYVCKHISI